MWKAFFMGQFSEIVSARENFADQARAVLSKLAADKFRKW
jgi:hypothetical protein